MGSSAALLAGLVKGAGGVYLDHVKQEHDDKMAMLQADLNYHVGALNSGNLDDEGVKTAQRHIQDIFTNFGKKKSKVKPDDIGTAIAGIHSHMSGNLPGDTDPSSTVNDEGRSGSPDPATAAATVPGTIPSAGSPVGAPPTMGAAPVAPTSTTAPGSTADLEGRAGQMVTPAMSAPTAPPAAGSTSASPVPAPPAAPTGIRGPYGLTYKTTKQKQDEAVALETARQNAKNSAVFKARQDAADGILDAEAEAAGMSPADYRAAHPDRVQQVNNSITNVKQGGVMRSGKDTLSGAQVPATTTTDMDGEPIDRSGKMMYREVQQNGKLVGWAKAGSPKVVGREARVQSFVKDAIAANPGLAPETAEKIAREKVQREENALMAERVTATVKNKALADKLSQEISQGNLSPSGAKGVYNVVARDVKAAMANDPRYISMKASDRLKAEGDMIDQQLITEGWDPNQVRKVMGGDRTASGPSAAKGGGSSSSAKKPTSSSAPPPKTWEELKKQLTGG